MSLLGSFATELASLGMSGWRLISDMARIYQDGVAIGGLRR
jgi:hypothetical protein